MVKEKKQQGQKEEPAEKKEKKQQGQKEEPAEKKVVNERHTVAWLKKMTGTNRSRGPILQMREDGLVYYSDGSLYEIQSRRKLDGPKYDPRLRRRLARDARKRGGVSPRSNMIVKHPWLPALFGIESCTVAEYNELVKKKQEKERKEKEEGTKEEGKAII